jgi:hypothetical protein
MVSDLPIGMVYRTFWLLSSCWWGKDVPIAINYTTDE